MGHLVDGESGGRSDSVATTVAISGEDSSNSMRGPSWYEMTLEDERESEHNSQFRVVWRASLAVDPIHAFKELSDPDGATSTIGGSRL